MHWQKDVCKATAIKWLQESCKEHRELDTTMGWSGYDDPSQKKITSFRLGEQHNLAGKVTLLRMILSFADGTDYTITVAPSLFWMFTKEASHG